MAFTISRYLKLKIADELSADAKYNLEKIDALGAIFARDTESDTNIRSSQNIAILPEDPSIGGSGSNSGSITLGDTNNKATVTVHSVDFFLRSALSLLNQSSEVGTVNYLSLRFLDDGDITTSRTLTVDVAGADRSISFPVDGQVVTTTGMQVLTSKSLSGLDNTISNIGYSSLLLSNSIINADISSSAAIATSKLSGPVTGIVGNGLGTLAVQNTASLTTDVTGILPILNGGTGNNGSDRTTALLNLLPDPTGQSEKVLRFYNGALEWYLASGTGTVQSVGLALPSEFTVSNSPVIANGTLTAGWAIQGVGNKVFASGDGLAAVPSFRSLVENDIPTLSQVKITNLTTDLAGKQATITGAASTITTTDLTVSRALESDASGKVAVSSVTSTELGYLSGVTSALQTQLGNKYDASNPSAFVNAAGAKSASVTTNINDADQTLAPNCTAVKTYVAAAGGAMSYTWAAGTPASPISGIYYKTITHNLNSLYLTVTVLDNTEEVIWVDSIVPADANSVVLGSSQQPPSDWTVIVRPAPAP